MSLAQLGGHGMGRLLLGSPLPLLHLGPSPSLEWPARRAVAGVKVVSVLAELSHPLSIL